MRMTPACATRVNRMRCALQSILAGIAACVALAGCEARVSIAEAQREASAAGELMKSAAALNAQGKSAEAEAQAKQAQEGFIRARDLYLSARADLSDEAEVLRDFAALCERLRDFDLAGEAFLRAAAQRPDDPASATLWYSAARNFVFAGGRYLPRAAEPLDQAERLLAQGSATDVSIADIEATRGEISWKNGAYELAAKRYATALAADPQSLRAKMLSACGAIAVGDLEFAGATLAELQAMNAPVGEGSAFDARLREAYAAFRRTRPALPEDAASYRALAGISVRVGFLDEARAAIEHAIRLDDRDVFAWNMAGSLAQQAGDVARARAAFTRSLELDPNQPRTQDALAQLTAAGTGQGPLK